MASHNANGFHASVLLGIGVLAACSGGGGSSTPPSDGESMAPAPAPDPVTVSSEPDVIYGNGLLNDGSKTLLLDVYQPEDTCTDPRPVVVGIHGGGFVSGSKNDAPWVNNMEAVAARGFVGLSIDYRLAGDDPLVSAEFQTILDDFNAAAMALGLTQSQLDQLNAAVAAMEDTVAALEWAESNAEARCLDMSRFAIWGSSAGAITALHVAHGLDEYLVDSPEPLVVIDYWGQLLLTDLVDTDGPPLMIIHGTADSTQIYEDTAVPLAAEAAAVGLPYSFYTIQGGPHGFSAINPDRVVINGTTGLEVTLDFIETHLTEGTPLYEVETIIPLAP